MAKKPSVRELRQHLAAKPPPELIEEIITLYTKYDAVKEFYMSQLHGTYGQDLLDRYKAIITKEFFPPGMRPGEGRISVARRAVMDYKKLAASPESVAEIMLHYVETGVAYTRSYGDIGATFYASMERMYADAITHILKHDLEAQFADRCKEIMRRADSTGWGFGEVLMEIYYNNFEIPEDDDDPEA
jgi:hypothetical protein